MDGSTASRIVTRQHHADAQNVWSFVRVAPAAELRGWIEGYCAYEERTSGFSTRRELPHAEGVLILNLGDAVRITGGDGLQLVLRAGEGFVAGVHLRPALSHSSGAQRGLQVQLPLVSLRRLLGVPMDQLQDRVLDLRTLWGAAAAGQLGELVESRATEAQVGCLDRLLAQRLLAAPVLDRRTLAALSLLRAAPALDIRAVADRVGWSRKHLANRIEDAVGVGPRSFRRLLRFQQLQQQLRGLPNAAIEWAVQAQQAGYCDQSHLIREFRELAGFSPGEFLRRRLEDGGGLVES